MEKFVNKHPRMFWFIVVGLAVLAFGIITALGCAKLEKAEAAVEFSVNAPEINYDTLPTYQQVVDAVVEIFGVSPSEVTAENAVMFTSDGNGYRVFYGDDIAKLECYGLTDGCMIDAKQTVTAVNINVTTGTVSSSSFNGGYMSIKSTRNEYQGYVWGAPVYCWERNGTMPILTPVTDYPKGAEYSPDAPYVSFDGLGYVNKIASGDTKLKVFSDIYDDYTTVSKWMFRGKLLNVTDADVSYKLDLSFDVELPNDSYILSLAESFGVDLSWEHNALNHTPEMVKAWSAYTGNDYMTYRYSHTIPLTVNERGEFEFEFTFPEIEYLLMGDDNFRERFKVYNGDKNTYWKAVLLSYLHLDTLTMSVETTRADSVVYGAVRSVRFERGYGNYYSALTRVDKNFVTPDLMEDMINSDLQVSQREHYKELENRLEELENTVNTQSGVLTGFDTEFDGNSLWGAVRSVGSGIIGMTGFLTGFAAVVGSFFSFLPYDMQKIIGYTVIVGVLLVLWRLFKK